MSRMDVYILAAIVVLALCGSAVVSAWRNRRIREFEAELARMRRGG